MAIHAIPDMIKYIILCTLGLVAFAEQPEPTNNYLALTATLLEHRIIGDDHLLRMIDGQLNPILEIEAQIDSQKLIASQAYENFLREPIDASKLAPWAKERLSQEAKERSDKKKKKEENRNLSALSPHQLIAVNGFETCHLGQASKLECAGTTVPDLTGKQISNFGYSALLLTSENSLFEITFIPDEDAEIHSEYKGKIENFAYHKYSTHNIKKSVFYITSYLCLLLKDGVTMCKINDSEFFDAPAHPNTVSLQIVKDTLYRVSPNGELDCFNLQNRTICTPPKTSQKIKRISPFETYSSDFCIIFEDGKYECFSSPNHEKIQIASPQNTPPVEMLFRGHRLSCGLFQTGLFSCWDDKGTYIDQVSEIPGIISAGIDLGRVCTVNESKQLHCYQIYNGIM